MSDLVAISASVWLAVGVSVLCVIGFRRVRVDRPRTLQVAAVLWPLSLVLVALFAVWSFCAELWSEWND